MIFCEPQEKKYRDMNKEEIQKLEEVIQSSHLNFLIGAGASCPFLPLLGDIESRLSVESNGIERIKIKKEYLERVMIPNKGIVNAENFEDFPSWNWNKETGIWEKRTAEQSIEKYRYTKEAYKVFFELVASILLKRKSTILAKQANIFTTNIDILMETALEEGKLEYNDGFSGRLNSIFSLSNFRKSSLKRSLHFENVSEIPSFNLMKIHGSLTWKKSNHEINFSRLEQLSIDLLTKNGADFESSYAQLTIVNPEKKKLEETVIDLNYYELLRMYSNELEKENTVLFVMGFSMADEHIKEISVRAADSNPTLKIYVFAHSEYAAIEIRKILDVERRRYSNIEILSPASDAEENLYDITQITKNIFAQVLDLTENGYGTE